MQYNIPVSAYGHRDLVLSYKDLNIKEENEVNLCPLCNKGIQTMPLAFKHGKTIVSSTQGKKEHNTVGIICKCPLCKELIFATYVDLGQQVEEYEYIEDWVLQYVYPYNKHQKEFSQEIENVSSMFVKIYNQAKQAETLGLEEICGVGYRKSLEFLIKDYLLQDNGQVAQNAISNLTQQNQNSNRYIKKFVTNEPGYTIQNVVEDMFLGDCIKYLVEDPRIKDCAQRAVYIGNDETHFIRQNVNKDIRDLKILIDLTINWVESEILTKKYIQEMQTR